MTSKKLATALLAATLSLGLPAVSNTASAQFVGPVQGAPTTVSGVLAHPVDDQFVTLNGRITSAVSDDKYMFTDNTGTIKVEIDDKIFAGRQVTPDMPVQIRGKIDKDFLKDPKIDVKRLDIISQ